eukprot:TRINITY_DN2857_c0_g1_i1.p1 TRINITY_DN2857_c0_g1~~TRINITY_DN2857_c0_g1_i1.p1  ORF type:complete len:275 (-),score=56.76 TRINITY_DN2857_c0_g1_i1:307-1131(-)
MEPNSDQPSNTEASENTDNAKQTNSPTEGALNPAEFHVTVAQPNINELTIPNESTDGETTRQENTSETEEHTDTKTYATSTIPTTTTPTPPTLEKTAKPTLPELKHELQVFVSQSEKEKTLTPILVQIIGETANTGITCFNWNHLCELISFLLKQVMTKYDSAKIDPGTVDSQRNKYADIMTRLAAFQSPPFTLQRICELLLNPTTFCSTLEKFLFAFEKMVTVTQTQTVYSEAEYEIAVKMLQDAYFHGGNKTKTGSAASLENGVKPSPMDIG